MIVLRVLSYNGTPADGPSAQFDEIGGTIGRAENNQLVLPDPERTISRIHARLVYRAGGYAVVDNGSNPISVNGVPVGAGREQPLKPGDQLQIGGYVLEASATGAADDPYAGLFDTAQLGLAAPPPISAGFAAAPAPAATGRTAAPAWPAPAAAPRPAAASAWSAAPPAPAPARASAAALAPGHIPDDWDPFAADAAADPAPAAAPAPPGDAFAGLPTGGGDTLDDLFGLAAVPKSGDPLGAGPAQALRAQPNMAQHADALESIARMANVLPPSQSDHASELNTPMILPPAAAPASRAAPQPAALPTGAVFSWNDPPSDGRVVTLPGRPRPAARATPATPAPVVPASGSPMRASATAPAPTRSTAAPSGSEAELLAALVEGLAVPGLRLQALTPETMHLLGQLLRESVRGAVELLLARSALKREMRAEVTMIVARENNPLKFSPTVEVALQHLLAPPASGFMAAAPALRDAFDDLRAHQLGVMAGMRAALDGVLQRFDPQQLEGKLTRGSAIASLIPATRKARLWELFTELFSQLQTEAQDDFDELFGKAFLRAYEDQLERLQRES